MKAFEMGPGKGKYLIFCQGCGTHHVIPTQSIKGISETVWGFNGDVNNPTFTPSLLVTWTNDHNIPQKYKCHSFIRDGKIEYLTDSTHKLAGQTIELPQIDKNPYL